MNKRRRFSSPVVGGITLLVTFAVLCLTVFAVLSVGTVQADGRLSDASAQAVKAYYEADACAELVFARIRAGEVPEGVEMAEGICRYACRISDTQDPAAGYRGLERAPMEGRVHGGLAGR